MSQTPIPPRAAITIGFAHAAYRLGERFAARATGLGHFEVRDADALKARIGEADVLVISGLWRDALLEAAPRLRFVQSISAGTDQYGKDAFRAKGVRLASAQGGNERAVAEHAMALILALARRLPEAVSNQLQRRWRPMISDWRAREDELGGKTLLIYGLGRIGQRLARLAKALDMRAIGIKRDPSSGPGHADAVHAPSEFPALAREADIVALTCPLTPETERLIGAKALAAFKPGAWLVNVARGRCVDEAALVEALRTGQLGAAALDCTHDEPLPGWSPLWIVPNLLITPHSAGETRRYEDNVLDILLDNLDRLWRGETALRNQIV